ncbi:MAG: hypothetical protein QOK35_1151 [Pseudonocardiales bacterium]|nr:hypothetical protein [Pseudonocardiales bacterium]
MWFAMSGLFLLMGLMMWVTVGAIVFAFWRAIPVPLVFGVLLWAGFRFRRRHRRRARFAAGTAPLPHRPAPPPRPDLAWSAARKRFTALRGEYAAHECDPMAVLRLPALSDVSVPSTARFVDAFAEAQALETETFPPASHAASFVRAVERAERAWHAARDAAERIRLSNLTPAERAAVERVVKLLTTARDSDNDAERLAAYSLARAELARLDRAGVIHMPRTAQAALEVAGRGQLPA